MIDETFINDLKHVLSQPLPGWEAHKILIPESRKQFELPQADQLHPAAVLIAIFPANGDWVFPLIRRTDDGFAHSGQISLPGGRKEGNETAIETALREANEEVKLPTNDIEILGKTSQLPIPVSQHLVQPVVGYLNKTPELEREPKEVEEIITISLREFVDLDILTETRSFSGIDFEIPYFQISGHKVWGATGMILSEFRQLLKKLI